jgi:hypothetical protein
MLKSDGIFRKWISSQLMNESFFWFASKAELGCEILKNTEDGNRYKEGCNCKYW